MLLLRPFHVRKEIQRAPRKDEPTLILTERMPRLDLKLRPISLRHPETNLPLPPSPQHIIQPHRANHITSIDRVIIGFIRKSQRHHALLLEIRLVDPCEALRQDDTPAQVSRLQGGVFARGAFAVVVFCYHEPFVALVFPFLG